MESHFILPVTGEADPAAVIRGDTWRFTILTSSLLRIEQDPSGKFEDRLTQVVRNRKFPVPEFTLTEDESTIEIDTESWHLFFRKGPVHKDSLYIDVKGNLSNYFARWYYGDEPRDLLGTSRTLDKVNGPCRLEHGLCSYNGHSWFDDSLSLLLKSDGWLERRDRTDVIDCYYFGYVRDYIGCIRDFYRLTGEPPMLPRYALGNWWCRFYPYSAKEYIELFDRFKKEDIPFSVAMLDLYWHLTDIPEKYGRGWGGYTWDRKLYPDPQGFLQELRNRKLAITINEHPNVGIRQYEDVYPKMVEDLGKQEGNPVLFDPTSPDFLTAYFKNIFRPLRSMGIDFVWIDWQQANHSEIPGLDPLWVLNHYHSQECAAAGKRPLILSRYSGLGSHRYPLGFSGDTFITWESLRFQPYFTNTAANVGYNCWSHDIGGHMKGYYDEELYLRWIQLGVFSPVMRIHSSNKTMIFKEPFNYGEPVGSIAGKFMRLRHQMIPYLYTMYYRTHTELRQLIEPMYYSHPYEHNAYDVPNQSWFGSQLLSCPITDPLEREPARAGVRVWLPPGLWTDFFTGRVYKGGCMLKMYRTLESFPVLAKAGAIVPLAEVSGDNGVDNPSVLDIRVFPGGDNSFTLYEDEGDGFAWHEGKCLKTTFTLKWGADPVFTILPPQGDFSVIPSDRRYTLLFCGFTEPDALRVNQGRTHIEIKSAYDKETASLKVELPLLPVREPLTITLAGSAPALWDYPRKKEKLKALLLYAHIEFDLKERMWDICAGAESAADAAARIQGIGDYNTEAGLINQWHIAYPEWPMSAPGRALLEAIAEIMV
jgi:hypothetical protein